MTSEFEANSYLYGGNAVFVEELFQRYLENPMNVDPSWQRFFEEMGHAPSHSPSWEINPTAIIGQVDPAELAEINKKQKGKKGAGDTASAADSMHALQLIHAYRVRGHLAANVDPLKLEPQEAHPELEPKAYGFGEEDYDRPIFLNGVLGKEHASLREILQILRATYCDTLGVEFMHIQYPDQKSWIQQRIESVQGIPSPSLEEKKALLHSLIEVDAFEEFLQVKYPGMKRFSIQGGDAAIAGLEAMMETAAEVGVEEIVIGMPHRGRMNVLTKTMGKPYAELLSIFHGNLDFPDSVVSSGDVKYHLGASHDRTMKNGKEIHLSLTANPSHLEVVNPVVSGKVRAKQDQKGDEDKNRVMGLTLHGDAAFAGQGSVPETLALSELRGYRTGGTVHVIVNNQIGFTTAPKYSRFTPYPSDVAKAVQAPIFHANGDDPEAVAYACKLATEFRQQFKRDVVVDVFCYRKYGHNESDEPMFTNPLMYKAISQKQSPARIYAQRLMVEGAVTQEHVDKEYADLTAHFEKEFEAGKDFKPNKANWLEGKWSGKEAAEAGLKPLSDTGVDKKMLTDIGMALSAEPASHTINRKIIRQLGNKRKMIESGEGFDWATAEALAFGSLISEGYPVRLSGQDCGRGTFSQRHSVLVDQENEERYVPLNNLGDSLQKACYEVIDSSLSELAILGFEYGYSLAEPDALVCWEAQFGDFANGAQMVIDQFISSGEIKWLRMCGLVMLLPHGYEGQGPEHSSARLERFLQMCGEDNMQVANCSTPANYFHILRRQLRRNFRKPLILMTPKSLLRHKLCVSSLADMEAGTHFMRVIPEIDKITAANKVRRVVFCSGKVYYDLLEVRRERNIDDIAVVRMEQFYPFPEEEVKEQLRFYKNADVTWCQEEPENMGAWRFVGPRIGNVLDQLGRESLRITYSGRPEAASPAAGYAKIHEREQEALVDDALSVKKEKMARKRAS